MDPQSDLSQINSGNAREFIQKDYGKSFEASNGNTYFLHDGILKPFAGPGFVTLSRGEFNILGLLNKKGIFSEALWIQ